MSELSRFNPTGRFTGLADVYARYRPSYPDVAVDFILSRCGLGRGSSLIDMGCGTGLSSRLFAQRGLRVIGVEPNPEMRARAEAEALLPGLPVPSYCDGRAEATGLAAGQADAVLAAQAFHWFEPEAALREFHRLLKPGGWVILMWNERDESDPFTTAYGAAFRAVPGTSAVEGARAQAGNALLVSPWFEAAECVRFPQEQPVDLDGLLGRAFSASYAPREPVLVEAFTNALGDLFARFEHDGRVVIRYGTSVYLGRRRERAGAGA